MKLSLFSRREKLLLGLLGSAMLFSFSFSYGAVNQAKVDSIMQTINTAANNFSSQADRDTYYQRVYTGLSDAIDMLAVVRNNVGAMIGTAPVDVVSPGNNVGTECADQNVNYTRTVNGSSLISTPNYDLTMKNGEVLSIEVVDGVAIGKFPGYSFPGMNIYWGSRDMPGARDFSISKCKGDFSSSAQILYRAEDESTQGAGYFYILSSTETAQPTLSNRSYKAVRQNTKGRWYINIRQKYCGLASSGINSCTLFYSLGSSAADSGTPPITNPIANYPIPAPCMAGTVLNKELLGTINGAWIERAFPKASDIVPGHVYKLRVDEPDGQGNGSIGWGDAPPERIGQTVNISPYPCDFVTLEQEKKYWGNRIKVAPSLTTWWDSVTVPASTTIGACMALGISGNHQYKIGSAFANPSISSLQDCTLVKGVTYYVNIRPSFTHMHGNGCNGTYACNYHLVDGGSQKMPSARLQLWGIYNNYEEFLIYKLKANVSSENVEALRQKVVSDYATKGVNTDGLTNTALGGTAVIPPVGTGGGPVIVREGPWERVEDIFCPATLTGATDGLQALYPNGYNYTNQGNTYWNVKDYQKPTDISLPATCTTGKKFVKHGMQGTCYVYECKN